MPFLTAYLLLLLCDPPSPPNSQGLTVRGQNVTVSQFDSKPIHQALEGGRN